MLNPGKYVILQQERQKVSYIMYNKECKVKHRGSLRVIQVEKVVRVWRKYNTKSLNYTKKGCKSDKTKKHRF